MEPAPAQAPAPLPVAPLPAGPRPAAPHVLPYEMAGPRRRRFESALFLPATLAGAVAAFLPFAYGVSPFWVVGHTGDIASSMELLLVLLAWPFLVPIVLLPYRLRVLLAGPASRAERVVAYAIAAGAAAVVVVFLLRAVPGISSPAECAVVAIGGGLTGTGAFLFARVATGAGDPDGAAVVALSVPYVANSAMVLFGFANNRDLGWYVTLAAAGAALAEMVLLAAAARRRGPQ